MANDIALVGDQIDSKSVRLLLKPILIDPESIKKGYRTRKSIFNTTKVHVVDVAAQEAKGWSVIKAGKRFFQMRRKKAISQLLEDRVWCLCKNMGYPELNGDHFTVQFTRENGSTGSKQIDVLAKDDDTVIVAECKSRESRGPKSLQKDLHETIFLQKSIADAIRQQFPGTDLKIIWLYITENIRWSEPDIDRADAGNIRIITENDLDYFETYISHVGTAGRYQFLAEFLKGQEIKGLKGLKIAAVKGRLGKDIFYSFTISARQLLKIAFVNHHALNHPEGRPAYQRMIEKKRLADIGQFIKSGGYFATNIIINFVARCTFEPLPKAKDAADWRFGHLILPDKFKSAFVIDGQHRLFGFTNLPDEYLDQPLFVLAFEQMEKSKEADLFITINNKQKSVQKALLEDLRADLQMGSDDPGDALSALASFLIRTINRDSTSPLFGRFVVPGIPARPEQVLTVPEIQNGLKRSELIGRVVKKIRISGYLSGGTQELTIDRARRTINGYFEAVESAAPDKWNLGRAGLILTNPGIRAHLMLLGEVTRYQHGLKRIDADTCTPEELVKSVIAYCAPLLSWLKTATPQEMQINFSRKYGEGGVKDYFYALCDVLSAADAQFGSEEYRDHKLRSQDERVSKAKLDVQDMEELIRKTVIEKLKSIWTTDELPSGEKKYWELGINDTHIKQEAYKKQQQAKPERRGLKEIYLDIIDFEKIIKQKGNWEYLKPIFDIPLPDKPEKGKQYHLDWLNEFNEIRKSAVHGRGLNDDDIILLDWLKQELYRRCQEAGIDPES